MILAEEYYKKSESTHFDEIKALALSDKLNGWKEYFWTGNYLYEYAPDTACYNLIIKVLERAFFEGLTYSEKDYYLKTLKILGRVYLETQKYDLALNNLQMLIIRGEDNIPDWVYLRYVFAQMHTQMAQLLVEEPKRFFDTVDKIDRSNKESVSQRNAVFQDYLQVCIQYYKSDGISIDTNTLFEKAFEYRVLHTEAWNEFASNFPKKFKVIPSKDIAEYSDDIVYVNSLSKSLLVEIERENVSLIQKMNRLQDEMSILLQNNQSYEHLLEQKNDLIKKITANDKCIDNINKSLQCGNDNGHGLLEGRKKILVIGQTEVSTEKLLGISKDYGYEKSDFVFWDDYSKIKSYAERMDGGSLSFIGIIAGPMPHKVSALGEHSSLLEKMKQAGYPHMEEARSESGELKITKHSFRKALEKMTQHLLAIQ